LPVSLILEPPHESSAAEVMISLPDDFVKRVDRATRAQSRSRSELIREALRAHLSRVSFVG